MQEHQYITSTRSAFWIPGWATASWGPFIPFIKADFGLTEDQLGALLMCMAIGAISSMTFASQAVGRFGCRVLIQITAVVLAACLIGVTIVDNVYVLGALLFTFGVANETACMAANVNAAALERLVNRNIMSGLHGLYSLGNAAGVLAMTTLFSIQFDLVNNNMLLTAACCSSLVLLYCGLWESRFLFTDVKSIGNEHHENEPQGSMLHPMLLCLGSFCFISFIIEGSMLSWTGVFMNSFRNVSMEEAGYAFAAFASMMTIFRLAGNRLVDHFGRRRVMMVGAALTSIGLVIAVTVPNTIATLIGFGLVGVGTSNIVPQTFSYAGAVKSVPLHKSIFVVSSLGYTGSLLGPATIGFLAYNIGLDNTFLLIAIGPLWVWTMVFFKIKNGLINNITIR